MKYIGAHVSISGGVENAPKKREKHRCKGLCHVYKKSEAVAGKTPDR